MEKTKRNCPNAYLTPRHGNRTIVTIPPLEDTTNTRRRLPRCEAPKRRVSSQQPRVGLGSGSP